jgi:hypothetical protein
MKPRFQNAELQKCYEHHLSTPPKARGGALQNAYFDGKDGKPHYLWPRNSLCYAAWAAGRKTAQTKKSV